MRYCLLLLALLATPAQAQQSEMRLACAPRQMVVQNMAIFGQQERTEVGILENNGWRLEVYRNAQGDWAIFVIDPIDPDFLCLVASGTDWETVTQTH